jgi:hypothetical protein
MLRTQTCKFIKHAHVRPGFGSVSIPRMCDSPTSREADLRNKCGMDPFIILPDKSNYIDQQIIKVQELPEHVSRFLACMCTFGHSACPLQPCLSLFASCDLHHVQQQARSSQDMLPLPFAQKCTLAGFPKVTSSWQLGHYSIPQVSQRQAGVSRCPPERCRATSSCRLTGTL